jgi:hypothetical protein
MANFGVYFNVTNNTGSPLGFMRADLDDATYDGPSSIPSQPQPTVVHLNDPYFSEGASGTVYFLGSVGGQLRQYAWYGSCPVGSSNEAAGPGITSWTGPSGHPTNINIFIDASTTGWTPWPPTEIATTKSIRAALAGKTPADPDKTVKFK